MQTDLTLTGVNYANSRDTVANMSAPNMRRWRWNRNLPAAENALAPTARYEANIPSRPRGQLESLLRDAGFGAVVVSTVKLTIVFPSVLDYVRSQIVATPMTVLLKDKTEPERQAVILSVASKTATLSTPAICQGGKFTFLQEAYVGIARNAL